MPIRFKTVAFALVAGGMICATGPAVAEPDMAAISKMEREAFVQKFGGIFENSPWVAEKAWDKRPFTSVDEMHAAMVIVARYAPAPKQIALLQAHPDLAGRKRRPAP
jgi:2-oxo-4-hydroxy-4-carboxy-5-ureidoimidazoline decarboxylase